MERIEKEWSESFKGMEGFVEEEEVETFLYIWGNGLKWDPLPPNSCLRIYNSTKEGPFGPVLGPKRSFICGPMRA